MFIIWGTKSRQERLGAVADLCPRCRDLCVFTVTSYFRVGHIYWIPLGRGTWVATARKCADCGIELHCEEEAYAEFLSKEEVSHLSMDEILRQTNPELERQLESHRKLQASEEAQHVEDLPEVLPVEEDEGAPRRPGWPGPGAG